MRPTQRLVLDTNVWLDWLVFGDAGITPIREAVARGNACVFMSATCEAELVRVLAYPLSGRALNAEQQAVALAQCRTIVRGAASDVSHDIAELPRCDDPDDIPFLELARDCGAHALITKDRDLLTLATRKVRPLPFRILTPREYILTFVREAPRRAGTA